MTSPVPGAPAARPRGVVLAVDVGSVRVGVAASDPDRILATPVTTLPRDPVGGSDLAAVAALVAERAAVEVVVGLPTTLRNRAGAAAEAARGYAAALAAQLDVPVRLVDERFTTVAGARALSAAGVRGPAARRVIDQAAAVALLQGDLDAGRAPAAAPAEPRPVRP